MRFVQQKFRNMFALLPLQPNVFTPYNLQHQIRFRSSKNDHTKHREHLYISLFQLQIMK